MADNNKKGKFKIGSIIRNLVLILAVGIFCYSGYQLITIYMEYKEGSDEYQDLEKYVDVAANSSNAETEKQIPEEKKEELTRIHLGDSQTAATAAVSTADTEAKLDWKQQKEEQARLRKIQNDLKKTETEIERLESREAEIDELMTQESVFTNVAECIKLNKEKEEIAEQLLSLMEQWEELSEQAAQ